MCNRGLFIFNNFICRRVQKKEQNYYDFALFLFTFIRVYLFYKNNDSLSVICVIQYFISKFVSLIQAIKLTSKVSYFILFNFM